MFDHLIFFGTSVPAWFSRTAEGLAPDLWWVPALVLFILALAATIDAYTAIIPDPLIFAGLLAVVGMQGIGVSWPFAAAHLAYAFAAMLVIWGINELWYRFFHQDALGMGDGKWTMLAVACFGSAAGVIAWGVGACLAILWIGVFSLMGYRTTRVHFAPFLLVGLLAGFYILHVNPTLFSAMKLKII